MNIRSLEDLDRWKACRDLHLFIAKMVVPLPKEERYCLGNQILRAARSTIANIAEGYGRFHYLDNARFCSNARGSCWEVLDHLITARDEELIAQGLLARGREMVERATKVLSGYMNYLKHDSSPTINEEPLTIND